jgi:O-antigen ligase
LRWEGSDGAARFYTYAHNEYAQVAADLGLVGLALLAVLLAAVGRLLWRSRPAGGTGGPWAGVVAAAVAFAVHGGLDFVWHLPAVVLAVTVLAGTVVPRPSGRAFVRDKTAVVEAQIFGCRPNICGSETDSETVRIQR